MLLDGPSRGRVLLLSSSTDGSSPGLPALLLAGLSVRRVLLLLL